MALFARGDRPWRLSSSIVLTFAFFAATVVAAAVALLIALTKEEDCLHLNSPMALFAALLRGISIVLALSGSMAYIHVGTRAPRPSQLHAHGAVLLLMLPELVVLFVAKYLDRERTSFASWVAYPIAYALWAIRKILFYSLIEQKVSLLGLPPSQGLNARLWVRALVASVFLVTFMSGIPARLWAAGLLLRGHAREEVAESVTLSVSSADSAVFAVLIAMTFVASTGYCIAGLGLLRAVWHLVHTAMAKLEQRHVDGKMADKVHRTLRHHMLGIFAAVVSSHLALLGEGIDGFITTENPHLEKLLQTATHFADDAGDIVGILLLSGIGVLLFREDPEAGDISGHIRGLLLSAVLTSRADIVFEGHVASTKSNSCIASFPGKFLPEWKALTWYCEQGELSSACVFLPTSDPKQRYGKHAPCSETPDKCWCHSLYGEAKPWGCLWFEAWKTNIDRAVALQLDLVVVCYPGQTGKGHVGWADLGQSDLWNDVGLGGSQKAEVAYLQKKGIPFTEEDVDATRLRRFAQGPHQPNPP